MKLICLFRSLSRGTWRIVLLPLAVGASAWPDRPKPWRTSKRFQRERDTRMARQSTPSPKPKISPEFARRLGRLAPGALVRAVVLLGMGPLPTAASGRPSKQQRKALGEAIRTAAAPALAEVDHLLELSGGRLLKSGPDVFGSIPVAAPASVLLDLADSEHVRAILENQPVSLLRDRSR